MRRERERERRGEGQRRGSWKERREEGRL